MCVCVSHVTRLYVTSEWIKKRKRDSLKSYFFFKKKFWIASKFSIKVLYLVGNDEVSDKRPCPPTSFHIINTLIHMHTQYTLIESDWSKWNHINPFFISVWMHSNKLLLKGKRYYSNLPSSSFLHKFSFHHLVCLLTLPCHGCRRCRIFFFYPLFTFVWSIYSLLFVRPLHAGWQLNGNVILPLDPR